MSLRPLWTALTGAMSSWHQWKLFIEHAVAIDHDALHIIAGVLSWLFFGLLWRRPLSSLWPWLCVVTLIFWNEAVDLWVERWPDLGMQYGEGAKDVLTTMFVPTLMMLAIRYVPRLFDPPRRRR